MRTNANKRQRKNEDLSKPLRGLPEKIAGLTGYTREGCRKSLIRMMSGGKPLTVMDMEVWQTLKKYASDLNLAVEELFENKTK